MADKGREDSERLFKEVLEEFASVGRYVLFPVGNDRILKAPESDDVLCRPTYNSWISSFEDQLAFDYRMED